VKEIDDFLPRWVTPSLSPRGYRKSAHTYRKRFESGDWGVFSFTGFPLPDVRGSFTAAAAFVPAPLFDWFNFAHPDAATKQPYASWINWGNPVKSLHGGDWQYQTDAEREICGGMLVERLTEVADLFDRFDSEPDLLLSLALAGKQQTFDELPWFGHHLEHPTWRAALLIRRGPSPGLEQALADADAYPILRLRQWADGYLTSRDHSV
jgi:hypothetical protein